MVSDPHSCCVLQYELLFCVEDETDSALMVVRSLMEKYPKIDAKLFIGEYLNVNPVFLYLFKH